MENLRQRGKKITSHNLRNKVSIDKDLYEKKTTSDQSLEIDEALLDFQPAREYLAFSRPSRETKSAFRNRTRLVKIANNWIMKGRKLKWDKYVQENPSDNQTGICTLII